MPWFAKDWAQEFASAKSSGEEIQMYRLNVCCMLHTIGICKGGEYSVNGHTQHRLNPLVPRALKRSATLGKEIPRRFNNTSITVEPIDSLEAGRKARNNGSKTLVLDFANALHPGGGYLNGKIAQEEDLCRRSNLCMAIDEQFGCTNPGYPIPEFESILVENVTVFRGPATEGYPLVEPAVMDFLVVAAYDARNSAREGFEVTTTKERTGAHLCDRSNVAFTEEGFLRTVHKINEAIFAVASEHTYDVLVLGAFGCGAFGNPPGEVAAIFRELLKIYAGCFREAIFPIPSNGASATNFVVFCNVLAMDMKNGVGYGSVETLPGNRPRFEFGLCCSKMALCVDQDHSKHASEHWHPPACSQSDCPFQADPTHTKLFRHKAPCSEKANCTKYFCEDPKLREAHREWFAHPNECSDLQCQDSSDNHLHSLMHLPMCEKGIDCLDQNDPNHLRRHVKPRCEDDMRCPRFGDREHLDAFAHSFHKVCPHPFSCNKLNDTKHTKDFAHVCPKGVHCQDKSRNHVTGWIHVCDHGCPHHRCNHLASGVASEIHKATFSHPEILDIRTVCTKLSNCDRIDDPVHSKGFRHPLPLIPASHCYGHNVLREMSTEAQTFHLTDFYRNGIDLEQRLQKWFLGNGGPVPKLLVTQVREWISNFRVVHRCSPDVFVKIWQTGSLMSLHCLQTVSVDAVACAEIAVQHHLVRKLENSHPALAGPLHDLCQLITRLVFMNKHEEENGGEHGKRNRKGGAHALCIELEAKIRQLMETLVQGKMANRQVHLLKDTINSFATAMLDLKDQDRHGIEHGHDERFETNKIVFGIFGPHSLNYGEDKLGGVHIIFRPDVIFHPDFFATPIAATFYGSGRADKERPWRPQHADARARFAQEKLHPADPRFFTVLAMEFIARCTCELKKDSQTVTLDDVMGWWADANAHYLIEAHLPYTVPFSHVESVAMHKANYEMLDSLVKQQMKEFLGDNGVHVVEGTKDDLDQTAFALTDAPISHHRPPCFAFHLFKNTHEVHLPSSIHGSEGSWVYFRVNQLPFFVSLTTEFQQYDQMITIMFTKDRTCITTSPPEVDQPAILAESTYLNTCQVPGQHYFYSIRVNPSKNQLVVKHAGPSLIYCRAKLKLHNPVLVTSQLRCINFGVLDKPVQFDEVRVIKSHHYKLKSPISKAAPTQKVVLRNALPARICQRDTKECKATKEKPGVLDRLKDFFGGTGDKVESILPLCPKGLHCSHYHECGSVANSCPDFSHICLYGQSCKCTDAQHKQHFVHLVKETCTKADCPLLGDVTHRALFHHPGFWDVLLPCAESWLCTNLTDHSHFHHFTHELVEYMITTDGSLEWKFVADSAPFDPVAEPNKTHSDGLHDHTGDSGLALTTLSEDAPTLPKTEVRSHRLPLKPMILARKKPEVDVVFSFDTTFSMRGYIAEVKKSLKATLRDLFKDLSDKCSMRLCIIAHGDYGEYGKIGTYVIKISGFSNDETLLQAFVDSCGETNGHDIPECYELVLYQANRLDWRSGALAKVLVLIGDCPPHEKTYTEFKPPAPPGGIDWQVEARLLAQSKVVVHTVKCGLMGGPFWDTVPMVTGGKTLPLSDAAKMPTLFGAIIAKCGDKGVWEEYKRLTKDSGLNEIYGILDSK